MLRTVKFDVCLWSRPASYFLLIRFNISASLSRFTSTNITVYLRLGSLKS